MKQEAKLVYLLECLQKTAPPVLIFAEKQTDVDDVHEYLMSKDVDAVAVHGQKTQEERAEAIDQFKVSEPRLLRCQQLAWIMLRSDGHMHMHYNAIYSGLPLFSG